MGHKALPRAGRLGSALRLPENRCSWSWSVTSGASGLPGLRRGDGATLSRRDVGFPHPWERERVPRPGEAPSVSRIAEGVPGPRSGTGCGARPRSPGGAAEPRRRAPGGRGRHAVPGEGSAAWGSLASREPRAVGLHKDISRQSFFLLRYQPAWLKPFAMFKRHRLLPVVQAFCCNTSKIIPKVRFMIEEVGASASREGVPPLAPWKRGESSQGDAGPRAWPCPPSEKWDETVEEKAPQTVLLRLPVLQRGGAVRTRGGGSLSGGSGSAPRVVSPSPA